MQQAHRFIHSLANNHLVLSIFDFRNYEIQQKGVRQKKYVVALKYNVCLTACKIQNFIDYCLPFQKLLSNPLAAELLCWIFENNNAFTCNFPEFILTSLLPFVARPILMSFALVHRTVEFSGF